MIACQIHSVSQLSIIYWKHSTLHCRTVSKERTTHISVRHNTHTLVHVITHSAGELPEMSLWMHSTINHHNVNVTAYLVLCSHEQTQLTACSNCYRGVPLWTRHPTQLLMLILTQYKCTSSCTSAQNTKLTVRSQCTSKCNCDGFVCTASHE